MLVGMIEDGELPTTRRLNDKERQHVQQTLACWVVDSCPGPEIEEGEHGAYICTAIERFAPEEEF